jgi:REP element-mobilizing transposase RayT
MDLIKDNYYHIYNRTINKEILFYKKDNYLFFLRKYRKLDNYLDTIAYCLMPTHFHFLVKIATGDQSKLKRALGDLLSSYTKALNKQTNRHGSLFQQHTKAKNIANIAQLVVNLHYIHQNPIRTKLVSKLEEWEFSSYRDYIGLRNGSLVMKSEILKNYKNIDEFIKHSYIMLE